MPQQNSTMRILGIDPGSRITGYGIIDVEKNNSCWVNSGCIRTPDEALPLRLKSIYQGLAQIIEQYQPTEMAIEKIFMARNPDSAFKLGQARGAAICVVANQDIPVNEYTPREIKQAIVGKGSATKTQMQHMVKALLNLSEVPQEDAADALAIALCHSHLRISLVNFKSAIATNMLDSNNNKIDLNEISSFKRSARKRRTKI